MCDGINTGDRLTRCMTLARRMHHSAPLHDILCTPHVKRTPHGTRFGAVFATTGQKDILRRSMVALSILSCTGKKENPGRKNEL